MKYYILKIDKNKISNIKNIVNVIWEFSCNNLIVVKSDDSINNIMNITGVIKYIENYNIGNFIELFNSVIKKV